MKSIKNILELVWTAWCLISALLIIAINFPLILLFISIWGEQESRVIDYYLRFCCRLILISWGIKMVFRNDPKLDFSKAYIYVANHRSYLDVFIAILGIKSYKRFLGKAEVFDWPIIGFLAKRLGHIPVKRQSETDREQSYQKILHVAKNNTSLFLCPEGAIFMNDQLLNEMRNGAFRVAIESSTPIVVISMINAGELFPPHKLRIRPGICINYLSAPFETEMLTLNDLEDLREKVKAEFLEKLNKHYPLGKYPIEFDQNRYEETVYKDTQKKTN
jgi:1-acyl-sn-glycerol-3-phosphate acyltransferase|tara:strand:+ start:905 stop:1729 length:825 start_codon:yes stop_codon:yes gene_type:complete